MFYKIARGVCIIVLHLLFRVKVEGKEHIPCKKGYILVANHRTNFDPLFVVARFRWIGVRGTPAQLTGRIT